MVWPIRRSDIRSSPAGHYFCIDTAAAMQCYAMSTSTRA